MTHPLAERRILAIDWGERRIGLAEKPAGAEAIVPLAAVAGAPAEAACAEIRRTIAEREIEIVVVGLPLHENPEAARRVKRFARRLRAGVSGVRWRFADESLTSAAAADARREVAPGRKDRNLDSAAAALILEAYLAGARGEDGA